MFSGPLRSRWILGGVGIHDLGIDGSGVGFDGDVGPELDKNGAGGLDRDEDSEEEKDDAAEEAAGTCHLLLLQITIFKLNSEAVVHIVCLTNFLG